MSDFSLKFRRPEDAKWVEHECELYMIPFTSDQMIAELKSQEFRNLPSLKYDRNGKERNGYKRDVPSFICAIFDYIKIYKKMPSQKEFAKFWIEQNKDFVRLNLLDKINGKDSDLPLRTRIAMNTLPNHMVLLVFLKELKEKKYSFLKDKDYTVLYSRYVDQQNHIDGLLFYKDKMFGLGVTSVKNAKQKESKYEKYDNVTEIICQKSQNKNEYSFFTEDDILKIWQDIERKSK